MTARAAPIGHMTQFLRRSMHWDTDGQAEVAGANFEKMSALIDWLSVVVLVQTERLKNGAIGSIGGTRWQRS